MSTLYLTYDGLMEQLGQSQVLPYLERLAANRRIILLSYEKPADLADGERLAYFKGVVQRHGIHWVPLRYHRTPSSLATAYDLIVAAAATTWLCLRYSVRIVHARSYVMAVIGLFAKRLLGRQFIFDMRGFWIDQRIEMGIWSEQSRACRVARWFERRCLQEADVVFSLSRNAVDAMSRWPAVQGREIRFEVVTTCADLTMFRPRATPRTSDSFTLGYVGNAGRGYLFEPAARVFLAIQKLRPQARFLIVNRNDHDIIARTLDDLGIDLAHVEIGGCDHHEVPARMQRMDAGVFFVQPAPSRALASVPTRLGEFLASGVPCIGNTACAEVEKILEGKGTGVAPADFSSATLEEAADRIVRLAQDPRTRDRCVAAAEEAFSLEKGVRVYEDVYRSLEANSR